MESLDYRNDPTFQPEDGIHGEVYDVGDDGIALLHFGTGKVIGSIMTLMQCRLPVIEVIDIKDGKPQHVIEKMDVLFEVLCQSAANYFSDEKNFCAINSIRSYLEKKRAINPFSTD